MNFGDRAERPIEQVTIPVVIPEHHFGIVKEFGFDPTLEEVIDMVKPLVNFPATNIIFGLESLVDATSAERVRLCAVLTFKDG